MGDFDSSLSLSTLLCNEDEACCFPQNDTPYETKADPCFRLEIGDVEYVENLILREKNFIFFDDSSSSSIVTRSWLSFARLDAIDWILSTRALFGFQFNTAYLSVVYFDRFLSKRYIDDGKLWAIRLLSVACFSLAAKMEECNVPPLSEFPMEDYCFENKVIQKMELLVLNTLEWKMGLITPFVYLHYFINKICDESRPKDTVFKAAELIMTVIKEINLLGHRPSVVAAAAVLVASNGQLTRKELEFKLSGISSWGALENEHLLSCYIAMQEIEMGKIKTPKLAMMSPNSSSSQHSRSIDVLDKSSFVSRDGSKRRLSFNECEQNYSVKKTCRR